MDWQNKSKECLQNPSLPGKERGGLAFALWRRKAERPWRRPPPNMSLLSSNWGHAGNSTLWGGPFSELPSSVRRQSLLRSSAITNPSLGISPAREAEPTCRGRGDCRCTPCPGRPYHRLSPIHFHPLIFPKNHLLFSRLPPEGAEWASRPHGECEICFPLMSWPCTSNTYFLLLVYCEFIS